ncbi:hypothetical protein BJF93_06415 [Xaviernesmea oryzae]|uniref:Glycosyltransferase 2-like domain-containing protein n=1 Tax=Xaviernesmea oryzae TaxID=464029 RepID=A0A1Q9ASA1_9HYPH|nr:hypothetical protein [Xaviernesmea oryzae]OLP58246.1 hypothetical protein BJF93_06415 [Xaviernesmea oryzae]SEL45037.1 hypothetical protein SAMN04487976_108129 [Xaviernesmea oryzae]
MATLSICIPVDADAPDLARLTGKLLAERTTDIEVIALFTADADKVPDELIAQAANDDRLIIERLDTTPETRALWRLVASRATGRWVTLVRPSDTVDPDLVVMVHYLERRDASVDALGWNSFQIDPLAVPGLAGPVAVPTHYHINSFDKTAMLKAFFYWEKSLNAPRMPFGLYHGALRRSLLDTLLALPVNDSWSSPVPQYEWAARVLLFSDALAFCDRPMSAMNMPAYRPPAVHRTSHDFPFHAGLGLTGAVAEAQFHVLGELGNNWTADENFLRACMIDCMMETERPAFVAKGNGYFAAFQAMGGTLASGFRPEFQPNRPEDRRRGLHGGALMVDRFLGGARTAQEFYDAANWILAPVPMICHEEQLQ